MTIRFMKLMLAVLLTIPLVAHATHAWRMRVEEYYAPFLLAKKQNKPLSAITPVLMTQAVERVVALYEKKNAQLLLMVKKIDQQIEFLDYCKRHPWLCRMYKLPTEWLSQRLSEVRIREDLNELLVLRKKYASILGTLHTTMQEFSTDHADTVVSQWIINVMTLIIGGPVAPIQRFEQLTVLEKCALEKMNQEMKTVSTLTRGAIISQRIEACATWTRRAAALAAIFGGTYKAYSYCVTQARNNGEEVRVPKKGNDEEFFDAHDEQEARPEPPHSERRERYRNAQREREENLRQRRNAGDELEERAGNSWSGFLMNLYRGQRRTLRDELLDTAEHRLRSTVEETMCDAEDMIEKYKREAPQIAREINEVIDAMYIRKAKQMAFTGLGRLSIIAGLGVTYWYAKRALGKHGAVYLAMKKNFQDMGYIITAHQGQSLAMEQLGNLIYISRQLHENALVVLSSDELELLKRDLDHITDPGVSIASKFETLKFMQRNYSFLAQKQAIIL